MPYITSPGDGAQLFYRDYRPAIFPPPFQPNEAAFESSPQLTLVFIHGWPMSSLMFDHLMLPLCETYRIRCIASDRRGFGKSDWSGAGRKEAITYETFADDTIHMIETLEPGGFVFVAASMGCGETVLAWGRSEFVKRHCKGFVFIGPSLPYPLQTPENPLAPPRELWDAILSGFRAARASFVTASLPNVFGAHVGTTVDASTMARFERIADAADSLALERCVQIITSYDFTERLKALMGMPLLVLQGDSDQSLPYEAGAKLIEALVPDTRMRVYEKGGHGIYLTHAQQVIEDILGFIQGRDEA